MTGFPILQFGTSRFLQAHVDLFVSEAAQAGQALGGITVVQTTANPQSSARTAALARAEGYEVIVRGLVKGAPVEERRRSTSVREALDTATGWQAVRERVRGPVQVIVSNTGDSGWALSDRDGPQLLARGSPAPQSFPAKLAVLLHDRWISQPQAPLTVLPCELVSRNGDRLRDLVVSVARSWNSPQGPIDWLQTHVVWGNSLVDRIVSEALEPVGAVAEPYALWAIERQPRLQLPCQHPAIVVTDDLARFERLKLFLLNLGHTVLADLWLRQDAKEKDEGMTVRQAMDAPGMREPLEAVWTQEVLPLFDARGEGDMARSYLDDLRDRLLNPFLQHRLADIAQNHEQKKARRIQPVVEMGGTQCPPIAQPLLRGVLHP